MTLPQELLILGDITTLVIGVAVTTQDPSHVPSSTCPSSSTPVKQEGTAAQTLQVSAEVYVVTEPECGTADVSRSQAQTTCHMSLGTQVRSDLSYHEDLSLSPPPSTDDKPGLCLEFDLTKSVVEAFNQIRAELQLVQDSVSGGEGLAPLLDEDMTTFEQLVLTEGLENLPHLQLKQLPYAGVQELVRVFNGVQIRLVPVEDLESDTSDMDTSHDPLPKGYFQADPLGLNLGDPSDLEEGEISGPSHPSEPMDQSDTLDHGIHPAGGAVRVASAALGGISDFQSEDIDTTAQPSEAERHSDKPMTSQNTWFHHSGPPDSD